ncbi:hypothetical protein HG536_0B00980 [Torulaspora globosa]|uniref:Topoisomerase 1-associated factor 1 n=1 Tax=Torulaspora globosa TaxID=48254 RepID=A0A7G3ZCK1_9SACH|nr:uncharacterized protein HG536_0B00980 [Torulaspora globosa]QLL31237.1 hypothetical protein HG536_0B00980 [Torulaspora globosa]
MSESEAPHATNEDSSLTVLKARIALLATAIGGPDYTSKLDPPPYKLGDDCLACLRDLKRWFKLVDDQQNRWDVAMACANYRILIDDLLPILIDWENKCYLAAKLSKEDNSNATSVFRNKEYHDSIALNCLQLMVLMTWPLILTEQSPSHQVALYTDLKKHQLSYKKQILLADDGKVLKAANRLAVNVLKINKVDRTPRENMVLRLVLHFFRNILAIEPGELSICAKQKSSSRGISSADMLPPDVSMDDISLNAVISAFHRNKVFGLLLTLSSSPAGEFDQEFINLPVMEVLFFLIKDLDHRVLITARKCKLQGSAEDEYSTAGLQLTQLLEKERRLKKIVVQNTSSRHSRFGALLSIQTHDNVRLTVSGGQNLLDDGSALKKLDNRKKWKKRVSTRQDDVVDKGLPNSLLNSQLKSVHLHSTTLKGFITFLENFIASAFNNVLHRITNHFTTELDQMTILQQVQYLLYYSWFLGYNREQRKLDGSVDATSVSGAVAETTFILVSSLLRKGYDEKNWIVTHAAMIAFNELLLLIGDESFKLSDDADFILPRLFNSERIQLLASLPKSSLRYSLQYMKSCVQLTHTALRTFEAYDNDSKLTISGNGKHERKASFSESDIASLMQSENLDRDEALELLSSSPKKYTINFEKVQRCYMNEPTIDSYISFLQRFKELDEEDLKRGLSFLHRVLTQSTEESLLFRIDLIVLLRDILSPQGISNASRLRKHFEDLSNYFLHSLKKKLKKSPAWFTGLLFPLLHDSEVGFYQKYCETKVIKKSAFYAVLPSRFKPIESEEELPSSHLLDMHFGILVSSLIDDGKQELVDGVIKHLSTIISDASINLNQNISNNTKSVKELVLDPDTNHDSLYFDKDFRALLARAGYCLPSTIKERCYISDGMEIAELDRNLQIITKYMTTPFETPNGLPSSSYLIRPKVNRDTGLEEQKEGDGDEPYDYTNPMIVSDSEANMVDDNGYFNDLQGSMMAEFDGREISKGLAKTKKSKNKRRTARSKKTSDADNNKHIRREKVLLSSKEFINDSDDEDFVNPVFFENEMYMRFLIDKHGGQLPDTKYTEFGKFAAERMANNGRTKNDFRNLFDGAIPQISDLRNGDFASTGPDKTLFSLSGLVSAQIEANTTNDGQIVSVESSNTKINENPEKPNSQVSTETRFANDDGSVSETPMTPTEQEDEHEMGHLARKRRRIFVEDDED